jgi:hypothetical protein
MKAWTQSDVIAWAVLAGGPTLLALGCGAMLAVQSHGIEARRAAAIATCNERASTVMAQSTDAGLPAVSSSAGADKSLYGTLGLEPQYRQSAAARGSYDVCMEHRYY